MIIMTACWLRVVWVVSSEVVFLLHSSRIPAFILSLGYSLCRAFVFYIPPNVLRVF